MIDFGAMTTTAEEIRTISAIVRRARELGVDRDPLGLHMDLEAAHETCRLDLAAMLAGAEGDLLHDVCGIVRHLDRTTGELGGCFVPRFAARA